MSVDHATDPLIGRTLRNGEYLLRETIAQGGQATVYRAYARGLETDVAVKILHPVLASDVGFRERFHDEARSLARLHHPNLIQVHWYGEEGELIYIVMRLVSGGTLRQRFEALGGVLGLTDAARTIAQVAEALQHAHDNNVLHLDIKPANVLLGNADWPLVADLGLTQVIEREPTRDGQARVAGTPAYMSPEQVRGGPLDGQSDQYSLAVTAYELLTGEQPFRAETTHGLMQQHLEATPRRPREVHPGLPGPVEDVLLRGLAKDPTERFPTVRAFGQALTEAVERTRGVTLATKQAAAATTPNLLSVLVLVLTAPFMLAMLPFGTLFGHIRLDFPFHLLFDGALAALLLGIRWHVIGLAERAVGQSLDVLGQTFRQQVGVGTRTVPRIAAWRRSAVGSIEGIVNIVYLAILYSLVGGAFLGMLRATVDQPTFRLAETTLVVLVGLAALGICATIVRSAGPISAVLALAVGWAASNALTVGYVSVGGGGHVAWAAQLVVAAGLLALLIGRRTPAGVLIGQVAAATLGRLLVESRPGITAEQATAGRRQIERLARGVVDVGYLLVGLTLIRTPLVETLTPISSPVTAALCASGIAGMVWLVVTVRLYWIAGLLGGLLGVVLGAPVLLSLPLLNAQLLDATWPTTAATWVIGVGVLLLLAVLRGPTHAVGDAALGAHLDHGLLGTSAAESEVHSVRRVGALGRVATAFIDICFLVIAYWAIGIPVSNILVRASGEPIVSSIVLAGVLLCAILRMLVPALQAVSILAETAGGHWRRRTRAVASLATVAAMLLVAVGAAAPAAIAGSAVGGPLSLTARQVAVVVVDWDYWLPWAPRADQTTYNLALLCSDGRPIGQFREAFSPPAGTPMPAGAVGQLGPTNVACADWQTEYLARRRAAGLPATPSHSWEWLDVQGTVNADQSVDLVETHRVFFSSGRHSSLTWNLGAEPADSITAIEVWEGATRFPLVTDAAPPSTPSARTWQQGNKRVVGWSFAEIAAPAVRTYTIHYRLAAPDAPTLFRQMVVGSQRVEPVWRATVHVRVPQVPDNELDLRATGSAAQSGLLGGRAWFEAADLAAGQGLAVTVSRRPGGEHAFSPLAPTGSGPTPTSTAGPAVVIGTPAPTSVAAGPLGPDTSTPPPAGSTMTPTPEVSSQTQASASPAPGAQTAGMLSVLAVATPDADLAGPQAAPTADADLAGLQAAPTADAAPIADAAPSPTPTEAPTATATPDPAPAPTETDIPVALAPTVPPSATPVPTATPAPPTATLVPPTSTPTHTPVPPTATPLVPTDTPMPPPTRTPTSTPPPPTSTPTLTPVPPTSTLTPIPPTFTPTPTTTPTPPPPCTMSITSFSVNPLSPTSGVTVSWTTRSTGDCGKVVGRLDEAYQNSPPGNYQLYHQHAVGFAGTRHIDQYPPTRCGGTFNVDYLLAFQNPDGSAVATSIRTVPFQWPACLR